MSRLAFRRNARLISFVQPLFKNLKIRNLEILKSVYGGQAIVSSVLDSLPGYLLGKLPITYWELFV